MADKAKLEFSEKHKSPVFRAAFLRVLDNPDVFDDGGKAWSVTPILLNKGDDAVFRKAFEEAGKKLWGEKWDGIKKHAKFQSPFKDGGEMISREGEPYAGFEAGQIVVKLSNKEGSPGIVSRLAQPIVEYGGKTLIDKDAGTYEELEENKLYSGCHMKATFTAMAYDHPKNFGVSFKLENLQKVKDGERLGGGGRAKATDDFEPIDGVDDAEFMG